MDVLKVDGGALYQWDTGRRVVVKPAEGCTVAEAHFANPDGDAAYIVKLKIEEGRIFAPIPNILLQGSGHVHVFATIVTADGKRTICDRIFNIRPRQKPSDYVYSETEVYSIKTALERALSDAKESGEFTGPEGKQGPEGKPGYTPEKGVDYYTDADKAELIEEVKTEINEIVEGKVDKIVPHPEFGSLYGIDSSGTPDMFLVDEGGNVEEGNIPRRSSSLSIYIPNPPEEDTDAVNKAYVDTQIGDISTILTALHEGGIQ